MWKARAFDFVCSKYEESTIIDIPNILRAMPPVSSHAHPWAACTYPREGSWLLVALG